MNKLQFISQLTKVEELLFGFAMRLTRNKEEAEDLMQETLLRSFRSRARFRLKTNFKAWITTIMYNSYISEYRKKKTRRKVEQSVNDFQVIVANHGHTAEADNVIMQKELEAMVLGLSEEHRSPFLLHYQGYQYDEIAELLQLPIGTVKSRIYYARKKLQGKIKAFYQLPE